MAAQEDKVVDELLDDGFSVVDDSNAKTDGGADVQADGGTDHEINDKETEMTKPAECVEKKTETVKVTKTETAATVKSNECVNEKTIEKCAKTDDDDTQSNDTTKDNTKLNGHKDDVKSDALLITTEEDLDLINDKDKKNVEMKKEINAEEDETQKKEGASLKTPKRKNGDVWVSNISRRVKATDLRKHFSRLGKVLTAKIVTNGRSFFGYIVMESDEVANKCVKSLHGSILDAKKVSVSRQRPDSQRRVVPERKPIKPIKPVERKDKKEDDEEKEKPPIESSSEKKERDVKRESQAKRNEMAEMLELTKNNNVKLKRELDYLRREVARLKRYLSDEQRRARTEQNKSRTLGKELQELESKMREERRKFEREREIYEKNARTDKARIDQDRQLMKKELEEVKKMREYFKRKIDEETRSMERRPRATSPYGYGGSSKRFREDANEKTSKYMEERTRTPPSPPKLSSRKRSPINTSFQMEKERRSSHHFDMSENYEKDISASRHGASSMSMPSKPSAPAAPRNIWPNSFYQDVWRVGPGQSGGGGGGGGGGGSSGTSAPFSSNQYPSRQSDYNSQSSSSKGPSYPPQRDFGKRDHYGSSVRKY